jgi:hypothetical protein
VRTGLRLRGWSDARSHMQTGQDGGEAERAGAGREGE